MEINNWKSFDVKNYIQSMVNANATEVSFVLTGLTGTGSDEDFSFISNQYFDSTYHAKLVVDSTPLAGAPVVTGTTTTNNTTPQWSWTSGGGGNGNYRYKLDNSDLSSGATETSVASYTPAIALSEGAHTLYVQESNGAGGWSASGNHTITIDVTSPAQPTISGFGLDTGSSSTDKITNDTTPTLTGTAEANSTVTVNCNGHLSGTTTADGSGNWSYPSPEQGDGTSSYSVTAADAAGNVSLPSYAYVITIDTTPPTVTGVTNGAFYNTSVTPGIGDGVATLTKDGGTAAPYTSTPIDAEGSYVLVSTDLAGNGTTISFVIDKTPPEVTGVTNGSVYGTSVSATFTEGTATLKKDSDSPLPYLTDTAINTNGSYQLVVTDLAGNSTTVDFTVDLATPPTITTTALPNATVGVEYNASLTATGTAPITWTLDSLDQPPPGIDLENDGDLSGMPATAGTYSFPVRATNAGGSDAYTATIQVDKGSQDAPDAPFLSSKTSTTVTLVSWSVMEYSKDGTTWQSSNVFPGLMPNTEYTFYMRLAETADYNPSPASAGTAITTAKATLWGSLGIAGAIKYGNTLFANVAGLTTIPSGVDMGTLSYTWLRNGVPISGVSGNSYTLALADIGQSISVTVNAVNCDGSVTSTGTTPVEKADGPAAPTVTGSYTGNGSTFTYTVDPIPGAEYKIDGGVWQDSNVFAGITPSVPFDIFWARIKATDTHKESAENAVVVTLTLLNDRPAPALQYTVSDGGFPKTITITEVTGAEYSFNGGTYGATRTYVSNSAEDVLLSIRLAATATHLASPQTSATVNTANQDQPAPSAFALTYENVSDTSYTVTIPATVGAEYSFDGTSWSAANTKTGCTPGTITGYKRMAAKPGYNESPITSASVTLPLFQVKTPTASPSGGTFIGSVSVTLTCATADAALYYTTDGSVPTTGSSLYTVPFTLTSNTIVKAIAVKAGMTDSGILSATFTQQSSEGSYMPPVPAVSIAPETRPNQPVTAISLVTATVGTNGAAIVGIPDQSIADAVSKAQAEAQTQGKSKNGIAVALNVTLPAGATSLSATLSQSALQSLVSAGVRSLTINSAPLPSVNLDLKALKAIRKQSKDNVTIEISLTQTFSGGTSSLIGTRPVYDVTASYVKRGKTRTITSISGGVATLYIPYTPDSNDNVKNLCGVAINSKGRATRVRGSFYDEKSGCIVIPLKQLSPSYGVGMR